MIRGALIGIQVVINILVFGKMLMQDIRISQLELMVAQQAEIIYQTFSIQQKIQFKVANDTHQ